MLGNLTIEEMEKRSGVKFPEALVNYMSSRKQEKAENIAKGKWHCFDIPFTLLCGDMETAQEIYNHLSPFSNEFEETMEIAIAN